MSKPSTPGFTLIELLCVIAILGTLVALAIPSMSGFKRAYDLRSSVENIAGQLQLAREKAIATGATQVIHMAADSLGTDYHVHTGGVVGTGWKLPKGITYDWVSGTASGYAFLSSGRCAPSGMVIVKDGRGFRDTVSVLQSGLVLIR